MANCNHCNDKIDEMPRPCKYCGKYFCSDHRQPESHDCQGLKKYSERERSKYHDGMVDLVSDLAQDEEDYNIEEQEVSIPNIKKEQEEYNPYKFTIKKKYIYRLIGLIITILILILLYKGGVLNGV